MKKSTITLTLFLLAFGIKAQTFDKAKMDSLFNLEAYELHKFEFELIKEE